ncbi:recombinase family protein [Fusobacterium sp. SYSU M8D902]|uniref:recombinase family protein n=1 Tax=Fusobacterium sp. SYSU M8D902 TaxID=3159562 RepID=UPI0032E45B97
MKYGYIRVSTRQQDETRQLVALINNGILKENIFIDKSTGTTFIGRTAWEKLLAKVVIGDIIVIKELDRLGRNNNEIKNNFEHLNKKGVFLEFLEQPLLNTYGMSKLERELLQPLVLHLLGYFAEKENEKRNTRQSEAYASLPRDDKGRMLSKKTGRPVGRKNALDNLTSEQRRAIELFSNSQISLEESIKLSNLKRSTIFKIKKILFPNSIRRKILTKDIENNIQLWINKKISLEEAKKRTGYSRSYLYNIKKNINVKKEII